MHEAFLAMEILVYGRDTIRSVFCGRYIFTWKGRKKEAI
jgi:hypothetical protein